VAGSFQKRRPRSWQFGEISKKREEGKISNGVRMGLIEPQNRKKRGIEKRNGILNLLQVDGVLVSENRRDA